MNPDTEKNINEAIDWLQQVSGSVQDFAVEQTPLYCREVVAWTFWSGVIWSSLGLIALIAGIAALFMFVKWMKQDGGEPNGRTIPAFVVMFLGLVTGPIALMNNLPSAIKAHVAPRLVIIEHLRGLK